MGNHRDPVAATASHSVADPYVNSCGEWTIDAVGISDEIREYTVYLNGIEEFTLTTELSDVETAVYLEVAGLSASCFFHDTESVAHCDEFTNLLHDPLICGGSMSIADLLQEIFRPPPPSEIEIAEAVAAAAQEIGGDGDGDLTTCEAYFHFGNAIWICECEDNSYENCFDCCTIVNPEPFPGSDLPFRRVRNCMADCQQDSCTCECDGGWFCQTQRSWCELLCIRKVFPSLTG